MCKKSKELFHRYLNIVIQLLRLKRDEIFQFFFAGVLTNRRLRVESGFAFREQ